MGLGTTNGPGKTGYYAKQAYDTANTALTIAQGAVSLDNIGYHKESTAYTAGLLVGAVGLTPGLVLLCTTAGTTASTSPTWSNYSFGDSVTDGTAVWTVTKYVTMDANGGIPTNIYIPGGYNKKETFTTSGSFTAPVTGVYKITLQGGGGGGGSAGKSNDVTRGGGGGGQGGVGYFYEKLTAGESYSYTIGTGGVGGTAGATPSVGVGGGNGGSSSITINNNIYIAEGGYGGPAMATDGAIAQGGSPGWLTINGVGVSAGMPGTPGTAGEKNAAGGAGGGPCGATIQSNSSYFGAGGAGGQINRYGNYYSGGAGGGGYITFEYYDPSI